MIQSVIQTIRAYRLPALYNPFELNHVVGIAMIATSGGYMIQQRTLAQQMIQMITPLGFYLWCVVLILFGAGMVLKPRYTLLWLTPFLVFLITAARMAFMQISITAIIYYTPLFLFPLYHFYKRQYPERCNQIRPLVDTAPTLLHRFVYRLVLLLNTNNPPQLVAGVLHALMAITLLISPNGAGMDLFYKALRPWLFGLLEPEQFYFLIYAITAVLLLTPVKHSKILLQILVMPFVVHGLIFIFVVVTESRSYALLPFFIFVTGLWWYTVGGKEYGC